MFFAKYGPVGTVKIMWRKSHWFPCEATAHQPISIPARGDEDASVGSFITTSRRARAGLSGFVSYMRRKDAEVAVKELDGLDWGGSVLRVGWSKAVKVPLRPIYGEVIWSKPVNVISDHSMGIRSLEWQERQGC
jgi:U2-associated protein SR140